MFRRSLKTFFALLLVFVLSSAALALQPQDSISARPEGSIYTVLRVDDLNGLLRYIFSPANVEMVTSMLKPDEAQGINLLASFVSQIPAKSVTLATGMTLEDGPFVQVAASMPDSLRPKLDKIAEGSATGIEIVTLLLGDGGLMFAAGFEPEIQNGAKGPYYNLMGMVGITAKEDLLLIAFPPVGLDAAIDALEKQENRLSFRNRFDNPNYWQVHMDTNALKRFAAMGGAEIALWYGVYALGELFKAPLEFEIGLASKPGSILLSGATNILESMTDSASFRDMKPASGGNMFLAGGGKLLLALSAPLAFSADNFKTHPELAEGWNKFIEGLEELNITESDVEDLLNGFISIALGSEATVMGADIPGGYIALTGREGAAAKILGKLTASENAPVIPFNADGWDMAFAANPEALPAPVVFGAAKDTLFVGIVNSGALTGTPELHAEFAKMLGDTLLGVGFIDTAGIWNRLRQETSNPASLLSPMMQEPIKGVLSFILESELSVPLIKLWSPEVEKGFMEFSLADVPQEKRLLPRLFEMGKMFQGQ